MGEDLLSWLFPSKATQGAVEKTPGILVLGAELVCPCGTSHSYLNLDTEHLNIADLPQANVSDAIPIDNILPFGSCRRYGSIGWPCKNIMDLAVKWENSKPQTMLDNGKEVITTDSTLICYVSGREIYPVTSGQEKENQFAEYKKVCEEIEIKYPGLLAILVNPHGSLYLQEGMYDLAIDFLEDYMNDARDGLLLSEIYTGKNPKDIFVIAALDRLLTDCDGSTFEQLINGLENTGAQTGMAQKEGWDVLKLNQTMIDMLRIDCKATSEKVNSSSFARWTEEHKKFVNILGNTVLQLAYDVMIWHCTTASEATKTAMNAWEKTNYGKLEGNYSGADNIADAARLKEYYRQAEKYGTGSIKELQNGRFRFYEELKPARSQGEMAGARHVREWDPYTGYKRDWYETLDYNGNIRQVRPDPKLTNGKKVHYMFDADGNYIGSWTPEK